jgi:FdhD protein
MTLPSFAAQASSSVPGVVLKIDGEPSRPVDGSVAVEEAVNVVYGTIPYAVMMMTPADLDDFAVGFSLTEGIVGSATDIRDIEAKPVVGGLLLNVNLAPDRLHRIFARKHAMTGRTGCGVCGVEDLAAVPRADRRHAKPVTFDPSAIFRALGDLSQHQVLNHVTHVVHAAAWADRDGRIQCVREDIGRHNALDKLIGALLRLGTDPSKGFLLVTSRCSYEMVEKTAAFGAGTLIAISAPTSLGIQRARHHGIVLVGVARHDAFTVYTGPYLDIRA